VRVCGCVRVRVWRWISVLTSDSLFEGRDEGDRLLKNSEFRLRFVRMKMQGHHPTELLKRLVYVTNTDPRTRTEAGRWTETQTYR